MRPQPPTAHNWSALFTHLLLAAALFALLPLAQPLLAQATPPNYSPQGTVTRESTAPGAPAITVIPKADSATVTYYCYAPSQRPQQVGRLSLTVSTISNANPGVATITSHGFNQYATISVLITGATGNWAPINGIRILTYVNANTLSIGVDTSGFGAWGAQSITVTTLAVRETDTLFSIQKVITDSGTGATLYSGWANNEAQAVNDNGKLKGGTADFAYACASRASYGYN